VNKKEQLEKGLEEEEEKKISKFFNTTDHYMCRGKYVGAKREKAFSALLKNPQHN
jgi:hypothetical protein